MVAALTKILRRKLAARGASLEEVDSITSSTDARLDVEDIAQVMRAGPTLISALRAAVVALDEAARDLLAEHRHDPYDENDDEDEPDRGDRRTMTIVNIQIPFKADAATDAANDSDTTDKDKE